MTLCAHAKSRWIALPIAMLLVLLLPLFGSAFAGEREEVIEHGQKLFARKGCGGCHTLGGGRLSGPDLKGVTERRERAWLLRWIKDPTTMLLNDPVAKELLQKYFVPMPNLGLTDAEVEAVVEYLTAFDRGRLEEEEDDD